MAAERRRRRGIGREAVSEIWGLVIDVLVVVVAVAAALALAALVLLVV